MVWLKLWFSHFDISFIIDFIIYTLLQIPFLSTNQAGYLQRKVSPYLQDK